MNLNKVILIGRISSDINESMSKSGVLFVRFSIAINRENFSNDKDDVSDFINVVGFRNNATYISKYFNKGDLVNIVGSLQTSQYTTKSGDIVSSMTVVIDQIKSLEPRSITQARAEKNNTTISNISKNIEETETTFYNENENNNQEKKDDNPWELDF